MRAKRPLCCPAADETVGNQEHAAEHRSDHRELPKPVLDEAERIARDHFLPPAVDGSPQSNFPHPSRRPPLIAEPDRRQWLEHDAQLVFNRLWSSILKSSAFSPTASVGVIEDGQPLEGSLGSVTTELWHSLLYYLPQGAADPESQNPETTLPQRWTSVLDLAFTASAAHRLLFAQALVVSSDCSECGGGDPQRCGMRAFWANLVLPHLPSPLTRIVGSKGPPPSPGTRWFLLNLFPVLSHLVRLKPQLFRTCLAP